MNPRDSTLPDLVLTTDSSERCRRSIKSKGFATVESFDDWEPLAVRAWFPSEGGIGPLAVRAWFLSEGGIDWVREVALLTEDIRDGGTEDERISSERTLASACRRDIADAVLHTVQSSVCNIRLNRVKQPIRSRARYYDVTTSLPSHFRLTVGFRRLIAGPIFVVGTQ